MSHIFLFHCPLFPSFLFSLIDSEQHDISLNFFSPQNFLYSFVSIHSLMFVYTRLLYDPITQTLAHFLKRHFFFLFFLFLLFFFILLFLLLIYQCISHVSFLNSLIQPICKTFKVEKGKKSKKGQ